MMMINHNDSNNINIKNADDSIDYYIYLVQTN